jgi:hypothetical protein
MQVEPADTDLSGESDKVGRHFGFVDDATGVGHQPSSTSGDALTSRLTALARPPG